MTQFDKEREPTPRVTVQALSDRRVPLAGDDDLVAAEELQISYLGVDGEPTCRALVDVQDGVARVREVTLTACEGGRPVRDKDLRAVQTDRLIRQALGLAAYEVIARDGEKSQIRAMFVGTKRLPTEVSSRAGKPDAFLQRVAEVYCSGDRHQIKTLMEELGVSRSTARRYRKLAVERGYL